MNLVVFVIGSIAIVYVAFILLTDNQDLPEPWVDMDAVRLCDHWPEAVTVRRHDELVCRECARQLDRMDGWDRKERR